MDQDQKLPVLSAPKPIRPKYQVFVSSTFVDLREERAAVTWEILKAGHIPVGMENFSSYDDRGWKVINRTLEATDYYVLILAGRYGSIDDSIGMSWTEREYQRALELEIPVLAFIRERSCIPGDQVDTDKKAKRLAAFISAVGNGRLREMWTTQDDLRAKVGMALLKAVGEDEADGNPRPGWYRGEQGASAAVANELASLSMENRSLRAENDRLKLQLSNTSETVFEVLAADGDGSRVASVDASQVFRMSPEVALGAYSEIEMKLGFAGSVGREGMLEHNASVARYLSKPSNASAVAKFTLCEALKECSVVRFAISNVTGPTETDVRCEIEFPEGTTLHCGPVLDRGPPTGAPRREKWVNRMELLDVPRLLSGGGDRFSLGRVTADGNILRLNAGKVQHGTVVAFLGADESRSLDAHARSDSLARVRPDRHRLPIRRRPWDPAVDEAATVVGRRGRCCRRGRRPRAHGRPWCGRRRPHGGGRGRRRVLDLDLVGLGGRPEDEEQDQHADQYGPNQAERPTAPRPLRVLIGLPLPLRHRGGVGGFTGRYELRVPAAS